MNLDPKQSLKNLRSNISARVSAKLSGQMTVEDASAAINDILSKMEPKARLKYLRTLPEVKELKGATKQVKDTAKNLEAMLRQAVAGVAFIKQDLLGADLDTLRDYMEKQVEGKTKKVTKKKEELFKAEMEAIGASSAFALFIGNDPDAVLRKMTEELGQNEEDEDGEEDDEGEGVE